MTINAMATIRNNSFLAAEKKESGKNLCKDKQKVRIVSMSGRDKLFEKKIRHKIVSRKQKQEQNSLLESLIDDVTFTTSSHR